MQELPAKRQEGNCTERHFRGLKKSKWGIFCKYM